MEPSEQDETEEPPRSEVAKREYRRPEVEELGDVHDMLNGKGREMLADPVTIHPRIDPTTTPLIHPARLA